MSTYHNAVSDKLVVFLYPNHSVFAVYSKENTLKYTIDNGTRHQLPDELLGAIFSTTSTISIGARSTLVPLEEKNHKAYFEANFGVNHTKLKLQNTDDCTIVYESSNAAGLENLLVNNQEHCDVELIYTYAGSKRYSDSLYYWEQDKSLSIMAWKEGRLVLANRYPTDTKDELFYYVMLVVEQLELPLDKLYLGCIATKEDHSIHHAMFQNYLPPLHLCNTVSADPSDVLVHFFAECVL